MTSESKTTSTDHYDTPAPWLLKTNTRFPRCKEKVQFLPRIEHKEEKEYTDDLTTLTKEEVDERIKKLMKAGKSVIRALWCTWPEGRHQVQGGVDFNIILCGDHLNLHRTTDYCDSTAVVKLSELSFLIDTSDLLKEDGFVIGFEMTLQQKLADFNKGTVFSAIAIGNASRQVYFHVLSPLQVECKFKVTDFKDLGGRLRSKRFNMSFHPLSVDAKTDILEEKL